jgi:hypothetical protein
MPRNVRNFWLDADVEGRTTRLTGGPVSRDGGFNLDIRMRDDGCVTKPVSITGRAYPDGTLMLRVFVEGSDAPIVVTTKR